MIKKYFLLTSLLVAGFILINAKSITKSINAALIEKSVARISDNLYAGKYEVSNNLYRQFLNDLRADKRDFDLKTCQIDSMNWTRINNGSMEVYATLYHVHPAYYEYPGVNISYEAANLFCVWLMDKYNSFPKRKFNKVRFRLPSEDEWIMAAKGRHPNQIYANGDSVRNKKGLLMYNFDASKEPGYKPNNTAKKANDNVEALAPCESYWPNDYGLYNMCGNVSEMTSTKGFAKGGNFIGNAEMIRIDARDYYEKTNCILGFRYYMDVINH
jgi:formylglycine-generating enzyme required for sulfatase activity